MNREIAGAAIGIMCVGVGAVTATSGSNVKSLVAGVAIGIGIVLLIQSLILISKKKKN